MEVGLHGTVNFYFREQLLTGSGVFVDSHSFFCLLGREFIELRNFVISRSWICVSVAAALKNCP